MINKQLQDFMGMRDSLVEERKNLEEQIRQIDEALRTPSGFSEGTGGRRRPKRARNQMNLKEAISKAISIKPLGRREILKAVQDLGYKFSTSHPLNSLSAALYSNKTFVKIGNAFGLAGDSKKSTPPSKNKKATTRKTAARKQK